MAIRDHVDADFNASGRQVDFKLDIYFDAIPITITPANYLSSCELLEEAFSDSGSVMGSVSANTLSIKLISEAGIFAPLNTAGPYYGLIKKGVKIIPYTRLTDSVDTLNWIQLGEFFVTEWTAEVTGMFATVSAADIMYTVINADQKALQVVNNATFEQDIEYFFTALGYSCDASTALSTVLPVFSTSKSTSDLSTFIDAAMAMCYCSRTGGILAEPFLATRALRATLTDADQIVSVSAEQTALKTYDGVELTYGVPQLDSNALLLSVKELTIPVGAFTHPIQEFSAGPAAAVSHVAAQTLLQTITVTSFSYTPWSIIISTDNATEVKSNLEVYGTAVKFTDTVLTDETDSLFKYKNTFIQTADYAAIYKAFLTAFIENDTPILLAEVRGNVLLKIGDKITVISERYNLSFTGIIIRASYRYNGGLSCSLTLLNNVILGGT